MKSYSKTEKKKKNNNKLYNEPFTDTELKAVIKQQKNKNHTLYNKILEKGVIPKG